VEGGKEVRWGCAHTQAVPPPNRPLHVSCWLGLRRVFVGLRPRMLR